MTITLECGCVQSLDNGGGKPRTEVYCGLAHMLEADDTYIVPIETPTEPKQ